VKKAGGNPELTEGPSRATTRKVESEGVSTGNRLNKIKANAVPEENRRVVEKKEKKKRVEDLRVERSDPGAKYFDSAPNAPALRSITLPKRIPVRVLQGKG